MLKIRITVQWLKCYEVSSYSELYTVHWHHFNRKCSWISITREWQSIFYGEWSWIVYVTRSEQWNNSERKKRRRNLRKNEKWEQKKTEQNKQRIDAKKDCRYFWVKQMNSKMFLYGNVEWYKLNELTLIHNFVLFLFYFLFFRFTLSSFKSCWYREPPWDIYVCMYADKTIERIIAQTRTP